MILYRPVGEAEMRLIAESGYTAFPPRLPEQPIFYPVLDEQYACDIVEKWNTRDERSGFKGYVTRFSVDDGFVRRYAPQTVGAPYQRELWVPAEDLEEFNRHIVGKIEVIKIFSGER